MIKQLYSLFLLLVLAGCSDDVIVMEEKPTVPVVYAIWNPYDSVQYVRVQRTFLIREKEDWENLNSDSLQFLDVEVLLYGRKDGSTKWTERFTETEAVKEEGFFPSEGYRLFKLGHPLKINLTYAGGLYRPDLDSLILEIRIHDLGLVTTAGAPVLTPGKLHVTNSIKILYLYGTHPTDFSLVGGSEGQTSSWKDDYTYKHIEFWVHYREFTSTGSESRTVHWKTNQGWTENGWYSLSPERILNRLRMLIEKNDSVEARVLDSIDVAIITASKAFNDYWFFREHWEDTDFPPPSNFDHSYGLFATYRIGKKTGWVLENRAMDTLCNSSFYKDLKFRNW